DLVQHLILLDILAVLEIHLQQIARRASLEHDVIDGLGAASELLVVGDGCLDDGSDGDGGVGAVAAGVSGAVASGEKGDEADQNGDAEQRMSGHDGRLSGRSRLSTYFDSVGSFSRSTSQRGRAFLNAATPWSETRVSLTNNFCSDFSACNVFSPSSLIG